MHTVDLLEEALLLAEKKGILIRRQWMAEGLGGMCRIGQQQLLFVNLAATCDEQLNQVIDALQSVTLSVEDLNISDSLKRRLL